MILSSYSCVSNVIHTCIFSMELLVAAYFIPGRERTVSEQCPGRRDWEKSRCRQPAPVAMERVNACNFSKELFLTNFFSKETLLLINFSLSCNEVQVFKDGLEKYSQLIKVYFALECFFPLPAQPDVIMKEPHKNCAPYAKSMVSILSIKKKGFKEVELKTNWFLFMLKHLQLFVPKWGQVFRK